MAAIAAPDRSETSNAAVPVRWSQPDPGWVRPTLVVLLVTTAGLYLWSLDSSGWANAYYSAAVQAGTHSWKAFFFGSFDWANLITVDKPPAALWVMGLSARLFGVNSWSILAPQAAMGVATVGVLYATVRRWAGSGAGLLAGTVVALTPVAALMFRFNNPDALLVLLLTLAAYAVVRAIDHDATGWLATAGALVGLGFLTKMLQAALVVPAFTAVFLVVAAGSLGRRLFQLAMAGVAMVAASAWWVVIVELWPASARPYIGGSQTNSVIELLLGYNGLGRLTGHETGSVVSAPGGATAGAGTSMWGQTGFGRLFDPQYGGQVSWLLPAALALLVAVVAVSWHTPRTDRLRASAIVWGGWLLVTAAVISFSAGIIHPYYTVALAPAIGALVGVGGVTLWSRRRSWWAAGALSGTLLLTTVWSVTLLNRSSQWQSWLHWVVLFVGFSTSAALLLLPVAGRRIGRGLAVSALTVALAGPAAYTLQTVVTAHSGSLPSAGPTVAMGLGGPGGIPGATPTGRPPTGALPGPPAANRAQPPAGGLLDAGAPRAELVDALTADASSYTWVAATVGANQAAGYQLATASPVMALGGFNGSDPSPTLAQFQRDVADGRVHWFIAGGSGGSGGPMAVSGASGASTTEQITSWVTRSFTPTTVGGVTVYDLSGSTPATST